MRRAGGRRVPLPGPQQSQLTPPAAGALQPGERGRLAEGCAATAAGPPGVNGSRTRSVARYVGLKLSVEGISCV